MDTFKIGGDLEVRRLGFGAMRITGDGIWGPPDDPDSARALLRRVVELGINLIDTADSYGPEVSENLIAEALHPYPDGPRDRHQGRLDPYRAGRVAARRAARAPAGGLRGEPPAAEGRPHRPLSAARAGPTGPLRGSVGTLKELQDEGKIRHIGVSNVTVEQLEQAREIVDVVSVQNRYNLTDRSSEDVLDACEDAGHRVHPMVPARMGSLAEPGGELDEVARAHDATPVRSRSLGCSLARR